VTFSLRRLLRDLFVKPPPHVRKSISRLAYEARREEDSTKPTVPDAKPWRSVIVPKTDPPKDPHQ
jgi:hypothetical protein